MPELNGRQRELVGSEVTRFMNAFGPQGAIWLAEGKTFEECRALSREQLQPEIDRLKRRGMSDSMATAAAGIKFRKPEPALAQPAAADFRKAATPPDRHG